MPSNGAAFQGSPVDSHLLVAATILATFRDIARIRAADMADLFPFPDCPNGPHAHPAEQGAIIQADHSAGQSPQLTGNTRVHAKPQVRE